MTMCFMTMCLRRRAVQEALRVARREKAQTRTRGVALGRSDDAEWLAAVRMSRKRGLDAVLPAIRDVSTDEVVATGSQSEHVVDQTNDVQQGCMDEEGLPRYLTGPRAQDPLLQGGPLAVTVAQESVSVGLASSQEGSVNTQHPLRSNDGQAVTMRPLLRRRLLGTRSVCDEGMSLKIDPICIIPVTGCVAMCQTYSCRRGYRPVTSGRGVWALQEPMQTSGGQALLWRSACSWCVRVSIVGETLGVCVVEISFTMWSTRSTLSRTTSHTTTLTLPCISTTGRVCAARLANNRVLQDAQTV